MQPWKVVTLALAVGVTLHDGPSVLAQQGVTEALDPSAWTVMAGIRLTAEQRTAIVAIAQRAAADEKGLDLRVRSLTSSRDTVAADSAASQLTQLRLARLTAIREVLTVAQRNTFDRNVEEVLARMERRRRFAQQSAGAK